MREPSRALGETILRRGSTREFRRDPIAGTRLTAILDAALRPLPLDLGQTDALVETYLLIHAVEDLASGAYAWDPEARALRLLKPGEFRREGGELCLEQPLGADASAVAFFLSDLDPVLARWGSRGYRAVNLAAGLLGGRLYLGAYGFGLGATGLTFYDDEVGGILRAGRGGQGGDLRHGARTGRAPPGATGSPGGAGRPRAAPPGRGLKRGEPNP